MAKKTQEDLFASSTMSFGEHLEELRVCLTRAVIGLVLGCIVGLVFADEVVVWIETPVKKALREHMVLVAQDELRAKYPPAVTDEVAQVIDENVLVFEEVLLERAELERLTRDEEASRARQSKQSAEKTEKADPPEATTDANPAEATTDADPAEATTEADRALPYNAFTADLPAPKMDFVKTRIWHRAEAKIQSLSPYESFMIYLKAALVVGAVVASPYIFLQIWTFVAAGLYHHERKYVYVFLPMSLGLFLGGASLAFVFVFEPVLKFLFGYNRAMNIAPDMRINDIISFVLLLPLGFGISFQLPLVMLFLNRLGIISLEMMVGKWRIAILLIFIASMILTPSGDPISMSLMALPLTGLYFLGLAMIKWMPRGRNPFGEEPDVK